MRIEFIIWIIEIIISNKDTEEAAANAIPGF